jgi:acetoin utilization deacetylase AcuC-like enzyme
MSSVRDRGGEAPGNGGVAVRRRTGFVYDPACLRHDPGRGHPERSARLVATMDRLEREPWFRDLVPVEAEPCPVDWLESVHAPQYIERAGKVCRAGGPFLDVPDVGVSRDSFDVARIAAGAGLALADRLVAGEIHNGFSLARPPGHHAERALALGFCLFNNVAILARYLQRRHGLERILVLDWDVHHGNGTQHTFEEDPTVLYASLHQYPFYPGTGAASEEGTGRGKGATVNCPMPAGARDALYEEAFRTRILPAIDSFGPDAVLLSAGFDAHAEDPLAAVELSTECYRWMSERVLEAADRHAGGRILSLLEGGYSLEALPECVAVHLECLAGAPAGE